MPSDDYLYPLMASPLDEWLEYQLALAERGLNPYVETDGGNRELAKILRRAIEDVSRLGQEGTTSGDSTQEAK